MRHVRGRYRIFVPVALIAVGAAIGAAATASGKTQQGVIKIGVLSTCQGPFAPFYDTTLAGAETGLMRTLGGKPAGPKPLDGITGATVGGKEIKLFFGCSNAVNPDKALAEARRLVEQVGVDILEGPLSGDEGIAVANYSKKQPGKTFVNGTSAAQDTTLKVRSPNFFRFNSDGAQWMAGVGAYAYQQLGWRKAVTIADDYSFAYTQTAGWVAEFCALGGQVVKRIWPPLGTKDYTSYINQIPTSGIDGIYFAVGGTGTLAVVKASPSLAANIAKHGIFGSITFGDPLLVKSLGKRSLGAVTGGPVASDATTPAFKSYIATIHKWYPNVVAEGSLWDVNNYMNSSAIALALKAVNGDLSGGQAKFRAALAKIVLKPPLNPVGTVRLDANRQGIGNNYVFQVQNAKEGSAGYIGEGLALRTLFTVPTVDQSFGGTFTTKTPSPGRTFPPCVKRKLPWIGHELPGAH